MKIRDSQKRIQIKDSKEITLSSRTKRTKVQGFVGLLALLLLESCCVGETRNPDFPLTFQEARERFTSLEKTPGQLQRPVVILGGYLDPGLGSWWVKRELRRLLGPGPLLNVNFFFCCSFAECREKLLREVEAAFPCDDPRRTTEVDVVALSMGGLVARHAAVAPDHNDAERKRLRIARLFTISSPHRGANLAAIPCFLTLHTDMHKESEFLAQLALEYARRDYELYPYARLRDWIVGAENTAPEGETPLWLSPRAFTPSHLAGATDKRILVDVALKLRGEPSYSVRNVPGTRRQELAPDKSRG